MWPSHPTRGRGHLTQRAPSNSRLYGSQDCFFDKHGLPKQQTPFNFTGNQKNPGAQEQTKQQQQQQEQQLNELSETKKDLEALRTRISKCRTIGDRLIRHEKEIVSELEDLKKEKQKTDHFKCELKEFIGISNSNSGYPSSNVGYRHDSYSMDAKDLQEFRTSYEKLDDEIEKTKKDVYVELKDLLSRHKVEVDDLNKKHKLEKSQFEASKTTLEKETGEWHSKNRTLETEVSLLRQENERLISESTEMQEALRAQKSYTSDIEKSCGALSSEIQLLRKGKEEMLEEQNCSNQHQKDSVNTLNGLRASVGKLRVENGILRADRKRLDSRIKKIESLLQETSNKPDTIMVPTPTERTTTDGKPGVPFRIWNRVHNFNDNSNFDVNLSLSSNPTVGEVRKAMAFHLRQDPNKVKLKRIVGSSGAVSVYQVDSHQWTYSFANLQGQPYRLNRIDQDEMVILSNDKAIFPIVKRFRNVLTVSLHDCDEAAEVYDDSYGGW